MSVIDLPEASRESQMELWGIKAECLSLRVFRRPPRTANADPEWGEAMEPGMGWILVSPRGSGQRRGGLTAHRGVIHPDEYVDYGVLASEVEYSLGFSLDDVRAAYRQGRKAPDTVALRDRIDARILDVVEAGGSRVWLARVLGWATTRTADGSEESRTLRRVLERAKSARASGLVVAA